MLCDLIVIAIIATTSLYLLPATINHKSEFIGFNSTFAIIEVIVILVMTKINKSIPYKDCEDGSWVIIDVMSKFLDYWSKIWALFMILSFTYIISNVVI